MKNFFKIKNQRGFTVIDLLVASVIIIVISSFVLASYRTGQSGSELNVALKQVINGITTARNLSLGGRVVDDWFPEGGYVIHFDFDNPTQYILFPTSSPPFIYPDPSYDSGSTKPQLSNKERSLINNIEFYSFCGSTQNVVDTTKLPCLAGDWSGIPWVASGDFLEINFSLDNEVLANYDISDPPGDGFKYIGGLIRHTKTNRTAYFYISLISGLVTGGRL